jgi:hypothetical protein
MSTADLTAAVRARLASIAEAALVAAEALDTADGSPALDLPEGALAGILAELVSLDGRLDLTLDWLAEALDPVGCGR